MNPTTLLRASRLAYSINATGDGFDPLDLDTLGGSRDYRFIKVGGDACFVCKVDGVTLIAFRGTQSYAGLKSITDFIKDWGGDAKCELVPYMQDTKVHRGFLESHQNLWVTLRNIPITKDVCITGHSKGGALAILAGLGFWRGGYNVRVTTFAAPRVGNKAFANYCDTRLGEDLVRWENMDDIIPHTPYDRSAGRLRFIHWDGTVRNDSLILRLRRRWRLIFAGDELIQDHFIDNYAKGVKDAG